MVSYRRVLAGLVVLAGLLAGCASPTQPAPASPEGAVKPKVDRVVLFLNPPPIESNDVRQTCCFDIGAMRPMYENLIGYEAKTGKFVPQLADSWNLENDGQAIRFKLHKGVQFNGGYGEMTAKDVKYTEEDLVGRIPRAYSLATWWKNTVKSIDLVNDYELVMNLNPNSALMEYISEAGGMLPIRAKAQRDKEGDKDSFDKPEVGTGAYEFANRQLASYIRFKRASDHHWRVAPEFPELEFRWSKEPSTRLAALLAGEAHITVLPDDLMPQAERAGMKIIQGTVPGTRSWGVWVCCNRTPEGQYYLDNSTPLLNVRVRQALNKAIDRDELQRAFFKKGERMYVNHMHQSWPGWEPSWERRYQDLYGYDPEGARKLLAEAGYSANNPLKTNVAIRPLVVLPTGQDVAEAIAGYWRKIGVDVTIIQTETAQQTDDIRNYKWSNHFYLDASSTHQVSAWPNRASDLQSYPTRGATSYFDPDTNKIVAQLERELDPAKQGPLMHDVGELMFTRFGSVPLFFVPVEAVVNPAFISAWTFPGPSFGTWTHVENIKSAR